MVCPRCGTTLADPTTRCPACGADPQATVAVPSPPPDATEHDAVRDALAADYELLEELGRGGMALVYRARERALEREVAVKVLPFGLAFDREFVERFQREARTAAQLEHPNIIPIYRVGQSGRVNYFAMKYLRGGSLAGVLRRRGRLAAPEVRRLLADCGGALAYAHQRGIVHRDIKPDNVMFDEFGQLLLTDFGIAKAVTGTGLTGTGMSIGTPHYMSPEQARAQAVDGRSDLYSLGVLAYQCLTGQVPFDGPDGFAIGMKHLHEPLPAPKLDTPDDRRLYELVRRMTMKDPVDRFDSCAALLNALRGEAMAPPGALTGGGPALAPRPVTVSQPTARVTPVRTGATAPRTSGRAAVSPAEPARSSSGTGIALLLLGLAGGAGAFWLATGRESAPPAAIGAALPPPVAPPPADSAPRPRDTVRAALDAPAPVPRAAAADAGTVAVASADSGALKLVGLPRGSSVLVDGAPVTTAVTPLPAGRHVVGVLAPLHQFFEDTVEIEPDVVLEVEPALVRRGAPLERIRRRAERRAAYVRDGGAASCDRPVAGYNAGNACYDVRPRPALPGTLPVPEGAAAVPPPSVLLVHVSAEGRVLEVRPLRPSADSLFEAAAQRFAATVDWVPALKGTAPVPGWTQLVVNPQPR
jgi:serine/threonine-protein kinase